MITREPYGISGAKIVRGEERPFVAEAVFTNDSPEMVQRCLNCTRPCPNGTCMYAPEYRANRKKKKKATIDFARARQVANMIRSGWREVAIAVELGIRDEDVKRAVKTAKKEGYLL